MAETRPRSLPVLGCWSAHPDQRHTLKIDQGRAWVTLTGEWGLINPDHVMTKGQCLEVAAGQHLVVENWPQNPNDALVIVWHPAAAIHEPSLAKPSIQL